MTTPKKCIGFDEEGQRFDCPNDAGTPWSPLWCLLCDRRRRARITRQLDDLKAALDALKETVDDG